VTADAVIKDLSFMLVLLESVERGCRFRGGSKQGPCRRCGQAVSIRL